MSRIHPLALISSSAQIGHNVAIGPFCVVEDGVVIGDGCQLASHVVLKSGTKLGANNSISEAAILGGLPQHATAKGPFGGLVIGNNNTIREHATMHRALSADKNTTIGDNNLFMAASHVGHDTTIHNNAILVNAVLLGGHVTVDDRAYLGGGSVVHQFCRIGRNAMIGGHARIVQDVPPYVMVDGDTAKICGLNLVGLRRAGYATEEIAQLKAAYRLIYRSGLLWDDLLAALGRDYATGPAAQFLPFFQGGKRGFIQERRLPPRATLKLTTGDQDDSHGDSTDTAARKAG